MTTATVAHPFRRAALGRSATWTPGPDVVDHSGQPPIAGRTFVRPPPPEIGRVRSARSTLKDGEDAMAPALRWGLAGVLGAIFPALVVAGEMMPPLRGDSAGESVLMLLTGAVLGLVLFAGTLYLTRFRRACTYVGDAGVARYTVAGSRDAAPRAEVFRFAAASELRARQTRQYLNGIYTRTDYDYAWTDSAGRKVFALAGYYSSAEGRPKPAADFWLARSAEAAWNTHRLAWVADQVATVGYAQFNLTGGDFVRVGPGFFEFGRKGEVARIDVADIKSLTLNLGEFDVHHKDARWFSRKGKYSFEYGTMANAELFLLAMARLTGYRFGG